MACRLQGCPTPPHGIEAGLLVCLPLLVSVYPGKNAVAFVRACFTACADRPVVEVDPKLSRNDKKNGNETLSWFKAFLTAEETKLLMSRQNYFCL